MSSTDKSEIEAQTRERLREAGRRLFAERGFGGVTVRDLAREAHANLAAIHYYFGDKLGLYRELVEEAVTAVRHDDFTLKAAAAASPAERVRRYVHTYLPQLVRPAGPAVWVQQIMGHEMHDPTDLAPWIAEQLIRPRIRFLSQAIAELLACAPDDPRVRRCVVSLQAQCLFYLPTPFRRVTVPGWREPGDAELVAIAEHITEFSLAGIERLRTAAG